MKKRWDRVLYKQIVQQPFQVTTALNLWYLHLVLKVITFGAALWSYDQTSGAWQPVYIDDNPYLPHLCLYVTLHSTTLANLYHLLAPTVDQACLAWHFVNSCWPHKAFQSFSHKTRRRPHMTSSCLTNYVII